MKLIFKNIISSLQQNIMTGIYPIITVNSSLKTDKSVINGSFLTYNNSCINLNNTTLNIGSKLDHKNIILNNSKMILDNDLIKSINTNCIKNNSFLNIGSILFNLNFIDDYSGVVSAGNILNYDFVWSSNLRYDYGTKTIQWQKYNKNTTLVNNINRIQIRVLNNKLFDNYNIALNFLYQNNLINGFYKSVIFLFNLQLIAQKYIAGFSLKNNKNLFSLNIPFQYDINCTDNILIKNMQSVTLTGLKISQITCLNSNVSLSRYYNDINFLLTSLNSNITLDSNLVTTSYTKLLNANYATSAYISASFINSNIKINQAKLDSYLKYENTEEYPNGYSIIINLTSELNRTIVKEFTSDTRGTLSVLFYINLLTIKNLTNYSYVEIKRNNNKQLFLSGLYNNIKNNMYTFVAGNYTLYLYNAKELNETLFTYDTFPYLGNRILSQETVTNSRRNNSYKYGLESHTHKYYNNLRSSYSKGTLYPTQSINNHVRLSNSNYASLLNLKLTCSYYLPLTSFLDSYIPQRTILPIGSIVAFYQVYVNNTWKPLIPHGFYRIGLTNQDINNDGIGDTNTIHIDMETLIDIDDPNTNTFNGEFAKMFEYKINENDNKTIAIPHYFAQPSGTNGIVNLQDNESGLGFRLIKLIKYAEKDEVNE